MKDTREKKRLIFLHIPKAGGTTFHSILERYYSKEEIFDIHVQGSELTTQEFINTTRENKERIKLLKGHMKFGLHEYFKPSDSAYITFLRNPVDRIVSHYYYVKRKADHYLHEKVVGKKMSLIDFALSDISEELDNGQTRLLTSNTDIALNHCSEDLLGNAINNLRNSFIGFGITEKFDESLILLKNRLQWKTFPYYMKLNVSENKKEIKVSAEEIAQIEKRNDKDLKLYQWALNEFEKQKNELSNFDLEMKILETAIISFADGFERGSKSGNAKGFKSGYEHAVKSHYLVRVEKKVRGAFSKGKKKD